MVANASESLNHFKQQEEKEPPTLRWKKFLRLTLKNHPLHIHKELHHKEVPHRIHRNFPRQAFREFHHLTFKEWQHLTHRGLLHLLHQKVSASSHYRKTIAEQRISIESDQQACVVYYDNLTNFTFL